MRERAFELMPHTTRRRYTMILENLATVEETMIRLHDQGKPIPDDLKHRREELERQMEAIELEFDIII
jgi:hypothetical protein